MSATSAGTAKHPFESENSPGYGLPCARCHLYYPANLEACPCCEGKERVPAVVSLPAGRAGASKPELAAAATQQAVEQTIEQEREAFLQQFNAIPTAVGESERAEGPAVCRLASRNDPDHSPASVCSTCYNNLQQRVDVLEAALRIELNEAARIVYQAVWADPSDPKKTYSNAAAALLSELRQRAGILNVLGNFQAPEN